VRRRDFIAFVGGAAAAWPYMARAQRKLPVIGYLSFTSPDERPTLLTAFLQGLEQEGYIPGHAVLIEYRSAEGHYERLPLLASELAALPVAVLVATGGEASARAAKGATSKIPVVFTTGGDPVRAGLVESLNHPGGNVTGVSLIGADLDAKRIQLLHQLLPKANTFGVLLNPNSPSTQRYSADLKSAADKTGVSILELEAGTESEIRSVFSSLQTRQVDALLVTTNPFYEGRKEQIVALAAQFSVPVLYPWREYAEAGGLISYGTSFTESYRQVGVYVGRILKGENPADLPVVQPTKFDFVINLRAAKALKLSAPQDLLIAADEVIE